jgi:hypothetical protein
MGFERSFDLVIFGRFSVTGYCDFGFVIENRMRDFS